MLLTEVPLNSLLIIALSLVSQENKPTDNLILLQ
jgi:hypothetical protein